MIIITELGFTQTYSRNPEINLIKELSSDSFWGRSIYKNGKQKALNQIVAFINQHSTFEYEVEYLVTDTVTFNYIKSIKIDLNEKPIAILTDFIPFGTIESANISGSIFDLNMEHIDENLTNKNVLIEYSSFSNQSHFSKILAQNPKSIFIKTNSLFFAPKTYQTPIPIIFIKSDIINGNDKFKLTSTSYLLPYPIVNLRITNKMHSSEKRIAFSAHYDHLGVLADTLIFNGANDNASGVGLATALFIETSKRQIPATLLLFDAEELGLLGSQALSNYVLTNDMLYLINLDMCASGDGSYGIVGLSSSDSTFQANTTAFFDINNVKVKYRNNAPNSDHYWFLKKDINGFYLYSQNGKQPYHSINDDFDTLKLPIYKKTKSLLLNFLFKNSNK